MNLFDKEAIFAASLGQVHKASLPNKDNVACKLQYPDMASAVEADLGQLKIIFKIYSSYNKSIQIREIYKEIEARLKEELDYKLEHKHLKVFNVDLCCCKKKNGPDIERIECVSLLRVKTKQNMGQPLKGLNPLIIKKRANIKEDCPN